MAKSKQYRRKGGYIAKYEEMLESLAYRDLSTVERCLLEEFQRIYRPGRNGVLSISTRRASELLNVTEPTACNAFYGLTAHGFIKLDKEHLWQERKAREWQLTFEPCNGREPTDEWLSWNPDDPYPVPFRKKPRPKKRGQICPKNNSSLPKKQGQSALKAVVSH